MELKTIAEELVAGCREGRETENLGKLYADSAVSLEPADQPDGSSRVTEGLEGIRGKHAWWAENFIVHSLEIHGPFMHGDDRFGVIFDMDAEMKATKDRHTMKELAIYHVADGKIVREEFFY